MGYTHYFTTSKNTPKEKWDDFCEGVSKLIELSDVKICGGLGTDEPEINDEQIWLNGDESLNEAHETFSIKFNSGERSFCKTIQKPYDEVVVASLILGKNLGVIEEWSSDGSAEDGDFDAAFELLNRYED